MTDADLATLIHSDDLQDEFQMLPWWKRPSQWWMLALAPLASIAASATIASRIRPYTLGCSVSQHNRNAILDKGIPCASDPVVQAAAAKLTTMVTTVVGVLTCLTVGYWGSFSDRHGRARVMTISLIAALGVDAAYISIVRFYGIFPGGSWFLIASAILEGLLGGRSFLQGNPAADAAILSYMADVSDEGSRSQFFSLVMGLTLIGVGIGRMIEMHLISKTQNILPAFYLAGILHLLLLVTIFFVLPESVTKERQQKSKELLFALPREKSQSVEKGQVGLESDITGSWVWECNNNDVMVKYLKPKPVVIKVQDPAAIPSEVIEKEVHSPKFDLNIVKASLGLNIAVFCLNGLTKSSLVFNVLSVVALFGLGFGPAAQSVALALYTRQGGVEAGRLIGSLAVVKAICGQLLAPFFFGVLYASTVASHPSAIFFVVAACLALAFVCIAAIRVREHEQKQVTEETLGELDPLLGSRSYDIPLATIISSFDRL
ncbi:hypothetical protein BJ165DRAFT_1407512 [Panaeolus papilionaceus]|nr:hypothetical protein BJ165DRAFT_1407512 [Panaeolus papilionaceus]